jgi:hypothetical protein
MRLQIEKIVSHFIGYGVLMASLKELTNSKSPIPRVPDTRFRFFVSQLEALIRIKRSMLGALVSYVITAHNGVAARVSRSAP